MSEHDKVISLGAIKADKSGNCKDWTPLEALKETVRELESGEMEMEALVILGWSRRNGISEFFQRFSGVSYSDATAMLALGQHKNLTQW